MTPEQVHTIIAQGESHYTELKERPDKSLPDEMVALANADGGRILLGVSDSGAIKGFVLDNDKKSQIRDGARNCDPPIHIELEPFEDERITVIHVPEGDNKPYHSSNGWFLRQGENSQKLTRDEILDFLQREGRIDFDSRVRKDVPYREVVAPGAVRNYMQEAGIDPDRIHPERFLANLGVLKGEEEDLYFTNAGLLFFSDRVVRDLPQATVQCVAFKGRDRADILDRKVLEHDLIRNLQEAELFLERHLNRGATIEGMKREDELEIPKVALREAVVNAVAHRDYLEEGAEVVIQIFKDRVEISNPGGLPPGYPPDRFGKLSLARNPIIVDLLRRANYMEKLGTGIDRIKREILSAHLPEPVFHHEGFFSITIQRSIGEMVEEVDGEEIAEHDTVSDIVNDIVSDIVNDIVSDKIKARLEELLKLLYHEPGVRAPTIMERLDVSWSTTQRDLKLLRNAVYFKGPAKTGGYYLNEEILERIERTK